MDHGVNTFYFVVWGNGESGLAAIRDGETTPRAIEIAQAHGFACAEEGNWVVEVVKRWEGNEYQAEGAFDAYTRYDRAVRGWVRVAA